MSTSAAPRRGYYYDLADLGCAGLGIGLALASVRLFSNGTAIALLGAVAIGSWSLATVLRRVRLRGWLADVVHLGIGIWLLLVLAAPGDNWFLLPGAVAVQTVVEAVRNDFGRFDADVAPLVAGTGHLVVMATLVWVLGLFNSTAAMRLRAPIQAVVPHLVAFVGLGFVAREPGRVAASAAMLASVGFYGLTQVAWRNAALSWWPRHTRVPQRSMRSGAAILAIAGVVTAVVAPLLPGGSDPVVDLRRGGLGDGGPRTVVSPFVEVGSNLFERGDQLLFTIESSTAQYWRLTALQTYDESRAIWVLSNSYEAVEGPLAPGEPAATAGLDVRGLGGIWVPAPETAITAEAGFGLSWDPTARSLIRRSGELAAGDAVDFATGSADSPQSTARYPDPGQLATARVADDSAELVDDSGSPQDLRQLAFEIGAGRAPYDALLALQNHFREGFTYDETVDLSGEADPLEAFLASRRGFCQQFSTAFALAARSLGYPSRVVVGFTSGDDVGESADGRSVFAVRGRHAHAWPEVHFEDVGWVPFEPTPGRGNPATSDITGIPGAQAAPPEGEPVPADLPTTVAAPTTGAPDPQAMPTTSADVQGVGPDDAAADTDGSSGLPNRLIASAVILVLVTATVAHVLRRRRRSTGDRPHDPVARQWNRVLRAVADRGLSMEPTETPFEFATRCATDLEVPELVELARLETARRWSAHPTGESDALAAQQAARSIDERLSGAQSSREPANA